MKLTKKAAVALLLFSVFAAGVSAQTSVKISTVEKKSLNAFFTNFSEIGMESIPSTGITDEMLINFSVNYNYRHNPKLFKQLAGGEQSEISENKVSESAQTFFGIKILKHRAVNDINYRKGFYIVQDASGEVYMFSQIRTLTEKQKGIFTAKIDVYSASSGWTGDVNASPKDWAKKRVDDDIPQLAFSVTAVIQKNAGKQTKYILKDYQKETVKEAIDYSGIYSVEDKKSFDLTISIVKDGSGFTYKFSGAAKGSGKLNLENSDDEVYLIFSANKPYKGKAAVGGIIRDGKLIIQNEGNSINPYTLFKDCDLKYIELGKQK